MRIESDGNHGDAAPQSYEGMSDREFKALPRGDIIDSWPDVPFCELEGDCIDVQH